jgi:hypothetical protein
MRLTNEELKELYQQETARTPWQRADCLSAEEMMRAVEDRMSRSERGRVADHLMACANCAEEYRVMRPLISSAAPQVGASHRAWRLPIFSPMRMPNAMAAAMLVVSVALGLWVYSLYAENRRLAASLNQQLSKQIPVAPATLERDDDARQDQEVERKISSPTPQTVGELSQPQINVPIYDIESDPDRGAGPSKPTAIYVPAGAKFLTLILNVNDNRSYPNYAMEVIDEHGKVVWRGQGLRKNESNTFTIVWPSRLFRAGRYRIKLYGLPGGKRELVEDYQVRVQYQ